MNAYVSSNTDIITDEMLPERSKFMVDVAIQPSQPMSTTSPDNNTITSVSELKFSSNE